jgi:transposase-like protein
VDETYVKVAGRWRYIYRAIDQFGQVIDVFVSPQRDAKAARRIFERAIGTTKITPVEVVTEKGGDLPDRAGRGAPDGVAPHRSVRQQSHRGRPRPSQVEAASDASAQAGSQRQVVIAGHGFVQNLRRGHYELAVEEPVIRRVEVAFDELALAI